MRERGCCALHVRTPAAQAEKVIRRNIELRCGSEDALTDRLKLQLAMIVIRAVREARQRGALIMA